ncbi:MAG: CCA tRNA nucleotidyltransferase [Mesorhizobium sp.]
MSRKLTPSNAPWLHDRQVQVLLAALTEGGEEARIAGGAVRDALLGRSGGDIDIATTNLPAETMRRAKAAGFRTVPTGIDHGTITVLVDGQPIEVTTLRADVETDGRHAVVRFGRDWQSDAERRDFTVNGLYATAEGEIVDLVGGVADLSSRTIRFIGEAGKRIEEDYLRILRFFRFFAWFGTGRPDAQGLIACTRLKGGLARLSVERVWSELRKLLSAPDPSRALLWARQASVLTTVLPETEKWGIDSIHGLVVAERERGWTRDPMLRLQAIVPRDPVRLKAMADRLRMSNAETDRLVAFALAPEIASSLGEAELLRLIYWGNRQAIIDRLRLAVAACPVREEAEILAGLLKRAEDWSRPDFPVGGTELAAIGVTPGPQMGALLKRLEREWVDSGFGLARPELVERAKTLAGETND